MTDSRNIHPCAHGRGCPCGQPPCAKLWNKIFKTGDIQIEDDKSNNVKLAKINSAKCFNETVKEHFLYSYTVESEFIFN